MKIKKIVIYGFGKHEDKTIDFDSGINVVYGQNEAGKTTIQQFILQILFGFPQKNSALLRYEPKSGGKYGGQVHVQDDDLGMVVIERVRGKSSGDVTVYFADGTEGGEAALKSLLRLYDRNSFESVFSFSLLQLQGFERMDEDELSRTLLASGTTGVDSLLRVEKKMEKEMGDLFKKTGRNPELNVRMQELKEMEMDLDRERERVSAYSPKMERIHAVVREAEEKRSELDKLRKDKKELSLRLQLLPLKNRKEALERKLDTLGRNTFPADGIRRLEAVNGRLAEIEASVRGFETEMALTKEELPDNPDSETLLAVERLLDREPEWHEWHSTISSMNESNRQLNEKKHQLLDRLGLVEADSILQADVSIHREEQLYELLEKAEKLSRQLDYLDQQLTHLENELSDVKKEQLHLAKETPSADELRKVEEWPALRERLAEAKAFLQMNERNTSNGNVLMFIILAVVSLAAIVLGIVEGQWLFMLIGIVVSIMAAVLVFGLKKQSASPKVAKMKQFVATYSGIDSQMTELVEKVEAYRQKLARLAEAEKGTVRRLAVLEDEHRAVLHEKEKIERALTGYFNEYGLHKIPNAGILHEFFSMVRSMQEIERSLAECMTKSERAASKIASRIEEARQLFKEVQEESLYEILRSEFLRLKTEKQSYTVLSGRLDELLRRKREADELVSSLRSLRHELLLEAGVETEEQYYQAYDDYQEAVLLNRQLEDTASQLSGHGSLTDSETLSEEQLKTSIGEAEDRINELEMLIDRLAEEKATLKVETEKLLSDDSLQRKQQLFEMKKAEFAELAKHWSIRQSIVQAINGMMKELKDRKLPEVLEDADRLFCGLTGDRYSSLSILENGLFQAISKDGMRYPIVELSQATKEQAYIALRLSLAMAMVKSAPFPILMDDPFVHFDATRFSRMTAILDQLSNQHQFIYFTCHDKIIEEWTNAKIIDVSTFGSAKGAVAR